MRTKSLSAVLLVCTVSTASASMIIKEETDNGETSFFAFDLHQCGKESLLLFDTWEQVSQRFANSSIIKQPSRRAELKRRASKWLREHYSREDCDFDYKWEL